MFALTAQMFWVHPNTMASNKAWTVRAVASTEGVLALYRQGERLFVAGESAALLSPVEHLLIAAAGCLALSCHAVMVGRFKLVGSVEVAATGEKATDPPSRLGQIQLSVHFVPAIDEVAAGAIIEQAKKACTVTNTLLGSPAVTTQAIWSDE